MPVYECECKSCGIDGEYLRQVKDCYDIPNCPNCGEMMDKVIRTAPRGYMVGNFDTFKSTVDGSLIGSQRELREHNKRNNVISLADGYSDDAVKAGNIGKKPEPDKTIKEDLVESFKQLKEGYTPRREVLNV